MRRNPGFNGLATKVPNHCNLGSGIKPVSLQVFCNGLFKKIVRAGSECTRLARYARFDSVRYVDRIAIHLLRNLGHDVIHLDKEGRSVFVRPADYAAELWDLLSSFWFEECTPPGRHLSRCMEVCTDGI